MCYPFQFQIDILMRDEAGNSYNEIDTFAITFPFPFGIQEQEYTGVRGIANITLSSDTICIKPDACNTTAVSSQLTGVTNLTNCCVVICKQAKMHFKSDCNFAKLFCIANFIWRGFKVANHYLDECL